MPAIPVSFAFDPLCPWCWQTSKWIRRCAELGAAEVTWGVYSLELAHHEHGPAAGDPAAPGVRGLRTAIAVRTAHGNDAMGAFYASLGERYFERLESYDDPATFHGALDDIGLDPALYDRAVARKTTFTTLVKEHRALVKETKAFGVPTIRTDGGRGPGIFGPVLSEMPDDDEAVEMLGHVVWLIEHDNVAELKRDRTRALDVERARLWERKRRARERARATAARTGRN
jgi:predicted DsbA family dithiol-disulfide isomerase